MALSSGRSTGDRADTPAQPGDRPWPWPRPHPLRLPARARRRRSRAAVRGL